MKIKQLLAIPIGIVLLAIVILMDRYLPGNNLLDFIQGLLMGLSLVLIIGYLLNGSRNAICN